MEQKKKFSALRFLGRILLCGFLFFVALTVVPCLFAAKKLGFLEAKEAVPVLSQEKIAAPDFRTKDLDGKEYSLSGLRDKPVIVHFWATWCGPCVHELPSLQQFHRDNPGIVVLAVNCGDDKEKIKKFAEKNGYDLTFLLDEDQRISSSYAIRGIPTSILVNTKGEVAGRFVGMQNWQSPQMKQSIEEFLKDE